MKAFLNWASSVVFLLVLVTVLYAYAHKQIAGFPDEPEKNVTLVPASTPPGDVALALEPPMATRQIEGQSQDLAFQFSNRSKVPVELLPVRVEPRECFAIDPVSSNTASLAGRETVLRIYRLQFLKNASCVRESPLIFIYSWKASQAQPAGRTSRRHKPRRARASAAKQPVVQERSIATTPIRVTNEGTYFNERFVRIGQLVLLPVLLAAVTFIFQRLQAARDEAQSEQTLKIEVWKIIHPTFLSMVKTYYAPLVRRMDAITGLIESGGQPENQFVLLLLLRRQILLLLNEDAGYYFQSKPGEDICGILNDALVRLWRTRLGESFDNDALLLSGGESAEEAKRLLAAGGVNIAAKAAILFAPDQVYENPPQFVDHALHLFVEVLAFESDRPFDAVWYDAKFPPKVSYAALRPELDWLQKGSRRSMKKALNEYRTSIPWRCVSDKSVTNWLERILSQIPLVRSLLY